MSALVCDVDATYVQCAASVAATRAQTIGGVVHRTAWSTTSAVAFRVGLTLVVLAALVAALVERRIAGAGLDVFDIEPLPKDHPLRKMDNVVITPHLGYVALKNYQNYFAGVVEDIRGFIDGKPVRVMTN